MTHELAELQQNALAELTAANQATVIEEWRVRYLGKKSRLNAVLHGLGSLPIEERKTVGALANSVRTALEQALTERTRQVKEAGFSAASTSGVLDITLPGTPPPVGRLHPLTRTINEMCDIFTSLGFQIKTGPDVEWDYYNFEALNIGEDHPARDNMATLWVKAKPHKDFGNLLLRTHTTSVTARTVKDFEPPIRMIAPGPVYRYEATDATHTQQFFQIDGFAVDKGITLADLKGTLYEFARRFFGPERKVRFRVDYFPFVEPGVEMAIDCAVCHGKGCRLCGDSGWLEILGAGMTHPEVLRRGGIDPDEYTSFAFGIGIERLPMLRYGIDDIRLFYQNDLRFLRQF
jgi:phenylalanyl-tRNA synthetase alpha chain